MTELLLLQLWIVCTVPPLRKPAGQAGVVPRAVQPAGAPALLRGPLPDARGRVEDRWSFGAADHLFLDALVPRAVHVW